MVIYQATEPVTPKWLRWPLALTGGFLSHWVLDGLSIFHRFQSLNAWSIGAISVQAIAITFAFMVLWANRQIVPYLISGLWAWLSWDWEHAYIALLHKPYACEFLHCQAAQIGLFPRSIRVTPEWTTLIEMLLVVIFTATITLRTYHSAPKFTLEKGQLI
jgi:hypothetical protein